MKKADVVDALQMAARVREEWERATQKYKSEMDALLTRLLNEAAVNMMSVEEVAEASGQTPTKIRALMRSRYLNPKNGKNLLAKQAAEVLANNALLLGVEPSEMDLTSPLAYLPMGSELREFLETKAVSRVTELRCDFDCDNCREDDDE